MSPESNDRTPGGDPRLSRDAGNPDRPDFIQPGHPPIPPPRFTRELTTLVTVPLLIYIVGWAPGWVWTSVVGATAALALWEFLSMGEKKGYPIHRFLSVALLAVILVGFVDPRISVEVGVFAVLLIIPASYVFARSDLESALPASAVCVLGILYVGMLAGAMIRLRLDFPTYGARLIFFLLIIVWIGDAGAYYVGKRFGRRKLMPRVSPKKTVEGGIGGIVISLLAAIGVHFAFFPEFPLHHAVFAAAILSTMGIIGDLAESAWKRSAAVKDSSGLIPGHGGFLDRIDSVIFTAPLLYAYWYILKIPG
ncbi:MAG TPA: phosphatidate cytidylyltransferase [Thermoanaerobaculia bacterium]|nr:phosphatidate cytidylyltransferase [Thermoanaerobaculia bacterium]